MLGTLCIPVGHARCLGAVVFVDLNNDGKLSIVEPAVKSDYYGRYTIPNVAVGSYVIRVTSSFTAGAFQTQPGTPDGTYQVTVPEGPLGDLDFGYNLSGANDFGSIMIEENVVSAAGAPHRFTYKTMQDAIKEAGFEPQLRNQQYEWREIPAAIKEQVIDY